jgi:hypothetical protein
VRVRGLLVAVAAGLVAAALVSAASAAIGDPRERHTPLGMVAASNGLLKRSDFGKDWKAKTAKPAGSSSLCRDTRPNLSDLVESGFAQSQDFNLGQLQSVSQWVRVFASPGQADKAWSRIVTIGLVSCLAKQLQAASNAKSKITIVGQYRLPVPKAGKNSAGFRVVSHAKTPDDSFNVYADIVVVQQGRAISVATMTGFIEPLATASEARLVRTIASRLGARIGAA